MGRGGGRIREPRGAAARSDLSGDEPRLERHRRDAPRQPRRACAHAAPRPARGGGVGPAHRVRERREPVPRAASPAGASSPSARRSERPPAAGAPAARGDLLAGDNRRGAGVILAGWSLQILRATGGVNLPLMERVTLDRRVLLVAAATSLACGLLTALRPALRAARVRDGAVLHAGSRRRAGAYARVKRL